MAHVVNMNVTDTAQTTPNTWSKPVALNYGQDYAVTTDSANNVQLSYKRAPFDAPQRVRFAATPVANIYANTDVDPSYQLPNKRGISLLAQLTQVVTVTDDVDPTYRVDLPLEAHMVIRIPKTSLLSDSQLFSVAERAYSLIFDASRGVDAPESLWFTDLIRGTMRPKSL